MLVMKVNKKLWIYGITKKLLIKETIKKLLINLAELMNIPNDAERPYVKILSR